MIENTPTDKFTSLFPTMTIDTVDVFKDKQGYTAKVTYNDGVVAYPTLWCDSAKQIYLSSLPGQLRFMIKQQTKTTMVYCSITVVTTANAKWR